MQVKWTSKARRDLFDVETFIAKDNPTAAVDAVLKIIAAAETLAEFSETARPGRVPDTRELVITGLPYIVPYRVRIPSSSSFASTTHPASGRNRSEQHCP